PPNSSPRNKYGIPSASSNASSPGWLNCGNRLLWGRLRTSTRSSTLAPLMSLMNPGKSQLEWPTVKSVFRFPAPTSGELCEDISQLVATYCTSSCPGAAPDAKRFASESFLCHLKRFEHGLGLIHGFAVFLGGNGIGDNA